MKMHGPRDLRFLFYFYWANDLGKQPLNLSRSNAPLSIAFHEQHRDLSNRHGHRVHRALLDLALGSD